MPRLLSLMILACTLISPAQKAIADDFIQWQNSSISLLSGGNFKVNGNHLSVITLEHANRWKYGDFFGFIDLSMDHSNGATTGWYFELAPRFSLVKMGLLSLPKDGFLRDLNIATTFERGKNGVESLLLGLGSSLKVDGFTYVNFNVYARKDTSRGANFDDMHVTISWKRPFKVGGQDFVIDGFMDYVAGWGPQAANMHLVPQIKWDMGHLMGMDKGRAYLGTEVDIWTNKYGIPSSDTFKTNQLAASALLKVHF